MSHTLVMQNLYPDNIYDDRPLLQDIKSRISLNQKFRVVFYGDSTTSCEWVQPNRRTIIEYVIKMNLEDFKQPAKGTGLRNYSWRNLNFINSGLSGATTEDFVERLERDVFSYFPDMVIYVGGDNDVDKISEQEHARNQATILQLLTNKVKYVYFATGISAGSVYHKKRYQQYIDEFLKSSPLYGAHFLNLFEQTKALPAEKVFTYVIDKEEEGFLIDEEKNNGIDAFHMNPLGNAYIAQFLLKEIFNLDFDPELYIEDSLDPSIKYPRYCKDEVEESISTRNYKKQTL